MTQLQGVLRMILESQVEQQLQKEFAKLTELDTYQIMQSRQVNEDGSRNEDDVSKSGIIMITTGFRQHDQFSLSPITLQANITVITRTEIDYTSAKHEKAVEAIANLLSYWHKFPQPMTTALTTEKFAVGELRIDGGTGKTYNKTDSIFQETIKITLRGTEKFNNI